MRFYTEQHQFYCGIDLHARRMYLCIMDGQGSIVHHKNHRANPESLMRALAPYRESVVVGCECMFAWYWVADACADHNIPFVLGHALYMKSIHGGKGKNDKIDSEKIARLLQSSFFPMAYAYPRGMREIRALLRRRMYLVHYRSDLLAHIQCTRQQYNLKPLGNNLTKKCYRKHVADEFPEGHLRKMAEVDLAIIEDLTPVITHLEQYIERHAKRQDPTSLNLLRTVPGIGSILALVILYEMHDVRRFKSAGQFSSYARLVKCQARSDGKLYGTSGAKIGNPYLKWAFSEAAVIFLHRTELAERYRKRLEKKHGKGGMFSIVAHRLGVAVYHMLKKRQVFDVYKFLNLPRPVLAEADALTA